MFFCFSFWYFFFYSFHSGTFFFLLLSSAVALCPFGVHFSFFILSLCSFGIFLCLVCLNTHMSFGVACVWAVTYLRNRAFTAVGLIVSRCRCFLMNLCAYMSVRFSLYFLSAMRAEYSPVAASSQCDVLVQATVNRWYWLVMIPYFQRVVSLES